MLLLLLLLMLFKKNLNILKHVCLFSLKCLPVKSEFQRTAVCNEFHHSVDHSVHSAHHSADCHPGHLPGGHAICLSLQILCKMQQATITWQVLSGDNLTSPCRTWTLLLSCPMPLSTILLVFL